MNRYGAAALVLAAGLAVPAAAKDAAPGVQGKWLIDKAATIEAMAGDQYKNAPADQQKAMRDGMPDMVVEFTATTATMTPGTGTPQVANYKVTKTEKTTVWMDVTPRDKAGAATEKMILEFAGPDVLNMKKEGDPMSLRLNRMKK
jgi:hypothetical protein